MGQLLTINFDRAKYEFQVVQLKHSAGFIESQILLGGNKVTICKDRKQGWRQKDEDLPLIQDLVRAIGNSISLRYRV